jgi:hypothetical protein
MSGAIEQTPQFYVVLEVLGAIIFGGPVRPDQFHVLAQRLAGAPGGIAALLPESPRPMILLRFGDNIVSAPHERSHRERIHYCKIA